MTAFTKTRQWISGQQVEQYCDRFFASRGWHIEHTTRHEERTLCLGDRWYTKPGQRFAIEYKSGVQTFYTGNVFLETISVDTTNTPGWVYTSQATFIFYACVLNHKILVFRPTQLREKIPELKQQFREAATGKGQNNSYNTHGLLVPLAYAEKCLAERIFDLPIGDEL